MLLITYTSDEVMASAMDFATETKLPLWIVGLFAPILFLFQKIKKWFGGLFQGGTEQAISDENESIKSDLAKLREEVNNLNEWRRDALNNEIKKIDAIKKNLDPLESRDEILKDKIRELSKRSTDEILSDMTDEEIQDEIEKRNASLGIKKGQLRRID